MADIKKPQVGSVTSVQASGSGGVAFTTLAPSQLARLEKAIIVGSVLSGLLAAGRIPTSPENRRTMHQAIAEGLDALNR